MVVASRYGGVAMIPRISNYMKRGRDVDPIQRAREKLPKIGTEALVAYS